MTFKPILIGGCALLLTMACAQHNDTQSVETSSTMAGSTAMTPTETAMATPASSATAPMTAATPGAPATSAPAVAASTPMVASPEQPTDTYPRRIAVDEARDLVQQGKAVIVDVRAPEAYQQEHIEGAILMPFNEIVANYDKLPKGKTLITYCT